MKKNKFWLAAMAVTVSMASCSLEEVMEQPEPQAIGFSSFVGKPTRAVTEIVNPGSTGGGTPLSTFYVFGKYGNATGDTYTNDVFSNTSVTVTATNTEIATAQYWVPNKYYKFAAYSDGNNSLTTTDEVSFDEKGHITIKDYEAGDKDLILAIPDEVQTGATITEGNPDAVSLTFNHLLSQVGFEFKNGFTNGYKVQITGLKINIPNKATYSYQTAYSWDEPDTNAEKIYTVNGDDKFDSSASKLSEYNFVIPQNNELLEAEFTVTVYDNNNIQIIQKKFSNVSLATGTTTTPGSDTNVWTPGYKYKYTATIDASVLDDVMFPIEFKVVAVEGWESSTGGNSNLPLN